MSFYKVKYSKSAEKFIKKNKAIGLKFFKAFDDIASKKEALHLYDVKKFHAKGYNDIFRLRIGSTRAIFRVIDDELVVFVFDIGQRGDIYKKVKL
ncbi:type II toxin-antitoxin system RelE/ParE family toxin [Fannyhessea vaginae]|uniref:type II toxin-antitoxin system RelE family toxin n=1 Tax=Fannyhessea vaginae TaxID=82135 RepID=UPI00336A338D